VLALHWLSAQSYFDAKKSCSGCFYRTTKLHECWCVCEEITCDAESANKISGQSGGAVI
jgi:hypothetical protein